MVERLHDFFDFKNMRKNILKNIKECLEYSELLECRKLKVEEDYHSLFDLLNKIQ